MIDATEWVDSYNDQILGFYQVAKYYYAPSRWEPGPQLSLYVNINAWNKLPKEYQEIVGAAAVDVNVNMMAHYGFVNPPALKSLLSKGVRLDSFSNEMLKAAQTQGFDIF